MTDLERNTRTLIVCFSLAIFGLIPLRFLEIGQQTPEDFGGATVLGETQVFENSQVVLPSAEVNQGYVLGDLEAPFNGDIVTDCMTKPQLDEAVARVNEGLMTGLYSDDSQANDEILWLNAQLCK